MKGQPRAFETDYEGKILIKYTKFLKDNSYKNEKQLEKEMYENIKELIKCYYDDEVIYSETNKNCLSNNTKKTKGKRIDIYAKGKNNDYIIECKNPKYSNENIQAIGQILNYGRYFQNAKLIIITTMFDLDTARTITMYNLPIKLLIVYGNKLLEYGGEK